MKPEILFLSYDGLTDPLGQSQILPYLQGLSNRYSITVITFEKSDAFQRFSTTVYDRCRATGLNWKPIKYHRRPSVISTLYDLSVLRSVVRRLISERSIQIVHCRSYLTALIGLWLKREFGLKFIFDMRGFWPDERVEGGLWNRKNPIYELIYVFFKRKEKEFLCRADHIVCLTETARDEISGWSIPHAPVSVIPTAVDMELFNPQMYQVESQVLRESLGILVHEFVLLYHGSWGTWYMTKEILDFFSAFAMLVPDSKLLILTRDHPVIEDSALARRVVVCEAGRNEVPKYLGMANASICFIKPVFSKKASSATKVAEAWSMNLPVVTNSAWGDIDNLKAEGFPLIICDSPSDYERVALQLVSYLKSDFRKILVGKFDLKSAVKMYDRIYESLTVV